ncbi:MAG: co-chaperone GroES [Candidatus Moraniibacteriota bacterium]|nr:MAG: co-chaperone GroES [Candidatus Moranbacteria bacterium]
MSKLQIQPLGENVLVRIGAKETKTASGLFLPESASGEREQQGTVAAVGSDKAIAVKKGDTVIFKRYGTSEELKVGDVDHLLLNYKDILAIVIS